MASDKLVEVVIGIDVEVSDEVRLALVEANREKVLRRTRIFTDKQDCSRSLTWYKRILNTPDKLERVRVILRDAEQVVCQGDLIEWAQKEFGSCYLTKRFLVVHLTDSVSHDEFAQFRRQHVLPLLDSGIQIRTVSDETQFVELVVSLSKAMERREREIVEIQSKNVKLVGAQRCGLKRLWQAQLEVLHDKTQKRKRFLFLNAPSPAVLRKEMLEKNCLLAETSYGQEVKMLARENNIPCDRYLEALHEQLE